MSRFKQFPTFHCHPMSFDSASTPEAFAQKELELGSGAITVTDHGTMGACRRVYDLAKSKGLTPILGIEGYFRDDNCSTLKAHGVENVKEYLKYTHVTIHCLDEKAFSKLSWKLSHARIERHGSEVKPLFDWADLEEIGAENVTIGSSCLIGIIQRHLLTETFDFAKRVEIATAYYERLRAICRPGNLYVEVFPHKCSSNWTSGVFLTAGGVTTKLWRSKKLRLEKAGEIHADRLAELFKSARWVEGDKLVAVMNNRKFQDVEPVEVSNVEILEGFIENECSPHVPDGDVQRTANKVVLELAQKYGDKIVIGDDSHFVEPGEKIVQDIRLGGGRKFSNSYHRLSSEEAYTYFESCGTDVKAFEGWVENSIEWSTRFKNFTFAPVVTLPTKFYPTDTIKHLKALINKHGRMREDDPVYLSRLKQEVALLYKNGTIDLLPYFFLAEEVTSLYERNGLLTGVGRGSAAGSLVAYLLGITHDDPVRYGLSIDRFLTVDRIKSGKLPDIDQDLPSRDLLVGDGSEKDMLEITLEDGSIRRTAPETLVRTLIGTVSVQKAFDEGLDVLSWETA